MCKMAEPILPWGRRCYEESLQPVRRCKQGRCTTPAAYPIISRCMDGAPPRQFGGAGAVNGPPMSANCASRRKARQIES